jgi:hypothetical protein
MTPLAELSAPDDTPIFGQPSIWAPRSLCAFALQPEEDIHAYPRIAPWRNLNRHLLAPYAVNLGNEPIVTVIVNSPTETVEIETLVDVEPETESTYLVASPYFETLLGTGDLFTEVRNNVVEVWRGVTSPRKSWAVVEADPAYPLIDVASGVTVGTTQPAEAVLLDIPEALKRARSQAGLPVQDLAAMFGIGRRQFYNLVSADQTTDDERAVRIARVTEAVGKVSEWVGPNSRKVRALLLARIEGDSIYDAAVADDDLRLEQALERAYSAAAQAATLPRRLPPSQRSTPEEAQAIRDYLRATRDDSSAASDQ